MCVSKDLFICLLIQSRYITEYLSKVAAVAFEIFIKWMSPINHLNVFEGFLMNSYSIFVVMLIAYIAVLVAISWYFNSRQKSITDFWLAGRTIGPAVLGFSAAASWLTAGGILAVVGYFMLQGMGSIWGFVAPNILALLVIAVLVGKIKSLPAIYAARTSGAAVWQCDQTANCPDYHCCNDSFFSRRYYRAFSGAAGLLWA